MLTLNGYSRLEVRQALRVAKREWRRDRGKDKAFNAQAPDALQIPLLEFHSFLDLKTHEFWLLTDFVSTGRFHGYSDELDFVEGFMARWHDPRVTTHIWR